MTLPVPQSFPAAAVLWATWCALAGDVDPRAWTELDIIPMPKQIRLTDRDLVLDSDQVVIVVGDRKCRQSEIGAQWINSRLRTMGARPLPVVSEQQIPPGRTALIVGAPGDNGLIARAVEGKEVNVGQGNPGQRGYEIRRPQQDRIFLAGADAIGALYACVTFGELLQRRGAHVFWRAVEVRDWPDVIWMQPGDYAVGDTAVPELAAVSVPWRAEAVSAAQREAYLEAWREHYDRLLRWKVTLTRYGVYLKGARYRPTKGMDLVREGIEYGTERGIGALVYAEYPFVGRKEYHPELWEKMPEPFKAVYGDWVRSLGMDDARRETARHLAKHLAHLGITHIGFHDTDTGSYLSPCQWNERSAEDRKRWGDDFAAATAHKIRIYYDALRQEAPGIQVIFTQYPYNVEILDPQYAQRQSIRRRYGAKTDEQIRTLREKTVRFWKRLHETLPLDIALSIREAPADPVRRFQDTVPGRPVFTWNAIQGSVTQNRLFGEGPRWAATFCRQPGNILQACAADIFVPLNSLALREYSWNVETPGAGLFGQAGGTENEIFTLVLPRICRNLFGPEAGPAVAAVLAPRAAPDQPPWNTTVIPWYIFTREDTTSSIDPRLISLVNTSARMAWQARLAEDAARSLDRLWEKRPRPGARLGMSDYAFRRFVNLREVFHACQWMARIRTRELRANELRTKDPGAARAAIDEGLALVARARERLGRLVRERPDDPVLQGDDHASYSGRTWRAFMADKVVLDAVEHRLRTAGAAMSGGIVLPQRMLAALTKDRTIQAAPRQGAITVDGRPDEPAWQDAWPLETLFVEGKAMQVARAHTRLRALRDAEALYVAIQCWASDGAEVSASDGVELRLRGFDARGDAVLLAWTPDGAIRSRGLAPRTGEGVATSVRREPSRWSLEARIPLESLPCALATDPWMRADLLRRCPRDGAVESSRLLSRSPKEEGDVGALVPIGPVADRFVPQVRIQFARGTQGVQTLADGVVTRVDLAGLQIETNVVLHNAVLTAQSRDREGRAQTLVLQPEGAEGKLTGLRQTLCRLKRLYYDHKEPRDKGYTLLFDALVPQVAVRLLLSAEEGDFAETIRVSPP